MNKFIYMMAGVALAAGMSSCVDTEKPVFQQPTTFTVNEPALRDQYLATTSDMDSKATFNLTCSQPDYGFAAQANYNAQVSLTGEFKDAVNDEESGEEVIPATYVSIANQDLNNASMSLKVYDLATAMCQLLGIDSEEAWDDYIADGGKTEGFKVYLRATCEIAGVANSFIASQNVVSYNNVQLSFAVPVAGVIWLIGDPNGFMEPSPGNAEALAPYQLIEPEIGCKIYGGTFTLPATEDVHAGATGNDYNTQFRFFTELNGWNDASVMIASNESDFYVLPITGDFSAGDEIGSLFTGDAVYGKGNWGIYCAEPTVMTMAVSLVDAKKPKVYFMYGAFDVTVGYSATGDKEPLFTAHVEE